MQNPNDERAHAVAANKQAWNQSAEHHLDTPYWQTLCRGFAQGQYSTFDETMTEALTRRALQGKSVVQVGCNNGRETLSLSAFGAVRCLGIDQSDAFLAQAHTLREIAQSDCEFLCANIYDLPASANKDFDMALITIGVLGWMPDLDGFFKAVASLLKPGGELLIYETHPVLEMFDPVADNPYLPAFSYFKDQPFIETEAIVYDGLKEDAEVHPAYWYIHKVSDILNGALRAGFQLLSFDEHPHSNREVEYDIYENQSAQLPMSYTLLARKP